MLLSDPIPPKDKHVLLLCQFIYFNYVLLLQQNGVELIATDVCEKNSSYHTMNLRDKMSLLCLKLVQSLSQIALKRSQFCLKHVSDKMSQFGLNLRPF